MYFLIIKLITMYFLVNKEVDLPPNIISINVFLLKEEIQKLIWKENPDASMVYKDEDTLQIFLYIYVKPSPDSKPLFPYTRIQVSDTPIN
jgi:hypothetical protein